MPPNAIEGPWQRFSRVTRARIGLGRSGDAVPTPHLLDFQYAHARARDAVLAAVDFRALAAQLAPATTVQVHSDAPDRGTYLRRPDRGRRLSSASVARLLPGPYDAAFVIADGLSASAIEQHAVPMLRELAARLPDWRLAPVVLAAQARVALGDEIGHRLGAEMVAVLIGERPGLSVPNSLGIYLTYAPEIGRRDSQRNCISNIHADGLSYEAAAVKLEWLMRQARLRRLTGVSLKEGAGTVAVADRGLPKILDSDAAALPCSTSQPGDDTC